MKGWVGWPTADDLPTLSGHPSAVRWEQDRESSPVKDRRSTTELRMYYVYSMPVPMSSVVDSSAVMGGCESNWQGQPQHQVSMKLAD